MTPRPRTAVCVHGAFATNLPVYVGHRLACLADGEGHFAITPIVGTRSPRGGQTRWFVFYKPLARAESRAC